MKKQFVLIASVIFLLATFSSCFRHHNTSISISDNEDVYRMTASFDRNKTKAVLHLLNDRLHTYNSLSLKNSSIDEEITLEDGTNFHMVSRPGKLKIKIDKTENSEEAFVKVKTMCDEIKDLLAGNNHYE